METVEIQVEPRNSGSHKKAPKLRCEGKLPGIFYGPKTDPVPLEINKKEFLSRVADLEGSGPILDAHVGNSQSGQQALQQQHLAVPGPVPVRALVDTGADMCVLSDGLARQLPPRCSKVRAKTTLPSPIHCPHPRVPERIPFAS